jgi:hypothetical protein
MEEKWGADQRDPRRLANWINPAGARKVHSLVDKVYKEKNLRLAWERVKANRGAGGVDRQTLAKFEEDLEVHLQRLHDGLGTNQRLPGFGEVAGAHTLQVEPQDQLLERLGLPQVRRQDLRAESRDRPAGCRYLTLRADGDPAVRDWQSAGGAGSRPKQIVPGRFSVCWTSACGGGRRGRSCPVRPSLPSILS